MRKNIALWIWMLSCLTALGWSATGRGRSQPITIDVRVRPTITSISPQQGSTLGGTAVTIVGANFALKDMKVKLAGTEATEVTTQSASQLTAKTPKGVAGATTVEVIHANGTTASLTEGFKYEAPLIQKVEISAEPKTLVANGVATSQITVKLVDQNGELVPSETVSLSTDQGTIPKVATNNQDGSYSAIYTASKQVGEVVITALTETHGKSGQVTLSLTERQLSTANSILTVAEEFVVIKGDDVAHLTVKLVDQQDLALEKQLISVKVEPSEGVTVSELIATDAKGQSKFELQSDQAGEKTVTVTVGDQALAQTATVKFTSNLVTQGVISAASARVVVGKLTTVTVTLQNQESLPVSAQAVEISVEPADQATITQPTELTNLQGQTTAQLLVKQAGLKTIQAKSGSLELAATSPAWKLTAMGCSYASTYLAWMKIVATGLYIVTVAVVNQRQDKVGNVWKH